MNENPSVPSGLLPPVVSVEWLQSHRDRVVLADVRWYLDGRDGHAAYLDGHIPGAIWVDVDADLSDAPGPARGRHPLPTSRHFADALGARGISDDAIVVGYDDQGGVYAARLVWMLRAIGQPSALLDGGLQAWPGELHRGAQTLPRVGREPVPWPVDRFRTADEVAQVIADRRGVVMDARAADRYAGQGNPALDPRPGHVPGAVNRPWSGNLDASLHFLPTEQLRRHYRDVGIEPGTDVTAYCGSGVSACLNLLALELLGHSGGRLYPGSWSAWGADAGRPVAVGPHPWPATRNQGPPESA